MTTGPFSADRSIDSRRTLPQVKPNVQPRAIADILPEVLARYGLELEEDKESPPLPDLPVVFNLEGRAELDGRAENEASH